MILTGSVDAYGGTSQTATCLILALDYYLKIDSHPIAIYYA